MYVNFKQMEESIPSTQFHSSKLPQYVSDKIKIIMRSAEFRSANTVFERVKILHSSEFSVSIQHACIAMGISTKSYYNSINCKTQTPVNTIRKPPNQLLTIEEENILLRSILEAQLDSACMNGTAVRLLASDLYFKRTLIKHIFDRFWFRDFMKRHSDTISKKKCLSVDDERGSLDREQIERYIAAINEALKGVTDLRLVLNMDETGFGRRPEYGKVRSCIFHKSCPIDPVWRSQTDNYHVSWVACISAGATYTKPFLLTTRAHLDPEAKSTFIPKFADFFRTPKGYQTQSSMLYWIQNILHPYVQQIRDEIGQQSHPVVLIMDGLGAHFNEEITQELDKLSPITIVPLPAHSSHITQPCDGCLFGLTKTIYKGTSIKEAYPPYTTKLLRIKKTIHQVLSEENIIASWKVCGFEIRIDDGICTHIEFKEEFAQYLRTEVDGSFLSQY